MFTWLKKLFGFGCSIKPTKKTVKKSKSKKRVSKSTPKKVVKKSKKSKK